MVNTSVMDYGFIESPGKRQKEGQEDREPRQESEGRPSRNLLVAFELQRKPAFVFLKAF